MRQQSRGILLEPVGEKQWDTARRQHLHGLMEQTLCQHQRTLTDVDG
jgi:hypothetical protein